MALFILSYLAGALTIFAPCILPVVPFVFARAGQPFAKSGAPLLAGMALGFAAVASLGAVAGGWAVQANVWGRAVAMTVLAAMGLALLAPALARRATRPLVALGSWLSNAAQRRPAAARSPVPTSFVLGLATGLVWAPCAGPVLGLVLTAAALQGPSVQTSLLLLGYAAGAATSLAILLRVGQRVFASLRQSLRYGDWLRKGLGLAVLAGVAAVALGLDTGGLATLSQGTQALEQALVNRLRPQPSTEGAGARSDRTPDPAGAFVRVQAPARPPLSLPSEGTMPPLSGAVEWLNSAPLTAAELRGKVVLVDFWTFGCINCRNALPHVREWHRKYKDQGLVVVGVHAPEFAFEKNIGNVKRALVDLGVAFPVAVDNDFAIWRAFGNQYWPAHYLVDAKGQVRFHHFGEGEYEKSEQVIRQLLDEARKDTRPS